MHKETSANLKYAFIQLTKQTSWLQEVSLSCRLHVGYYTSTSGQIPAVIFAVLTQDFPMHAPESIQMWRNLFILL